MKDFNLHILGCGSALPTVQHYPTAQILEVRGRIYMIDCGEGAQLQMRRMRLNLARISVIFISHLHGDHCFGLPGLLSSLGMLGRTADLELFGPVGLEAYLRPILMQFCDHMPYQVRIHEVDHLHSQQIWLDKSVSVQTIPLSHRIPAVGYLFREQRQILHLDKASADFYGVPRSFYPQLLRGEDYTTDEGQVIANARLTKQGNPPRSYAYCSDTVRLPENVPLLRGVHLLYHEATFLHSERERAQQTGHSTASDAAQMALEAEVGQLMIGHYSARYYGTEAHLQEAQSIFPNTIAAHEGLTLHL